MASKAKKNKVQETIFAPGTRHETIKPSLATLTRLPSPINGKAKASPGQDKQQFVMGLLQSAGAEGITWAAIQAELKAKFGMAPKKRHLLYAVLNGVVHYKVTGSKGVVVYHLGKAPRKAKAKAN
jgi:hypothetical protein